MAEKSTKLVKVENLYLSFSRQIQHHWKKHFIFGSFSGQKTAKNCYCFHTKVRNPLKTNAMHNFIYVKCNAQAELGLTCLYN